MVEIYSENAYYHSLQNRFSSHLRSENANLIYTEIYFTRCYVWYMQVPLGFKGLMWKSIIELDTYYNPSYLPFLLIK
jgi:hypothetical protein